MKRGTFIIWGLCLFLSQNNHAQSIDTSFIPSLLKKHKIAGTSYAVVKNGQIIGLNAFGHAHLQNDERLTVNHYFQVASLSKMISSMMLLCLQKRFPEIINLNTPLSDYLHDGLNPNSTTAKWAKKVFKSSSKEYTQEISFQRLLSHSAGMSVHGIGVYPEFLTPTLTDILYTGVFQEKVEPMWKPGTKYSYSGGGYTVAESMIQDLLNQPANKLFERELKECLEVEEMTWANATDFQGPIARGHFRQQLTFDQMNSPVEMAGGLLSTPKAYAEVVIKIMDNFDSQLVSQLLTPSLHKDSSLSQCLGDDNCTILNEQCFNGSCGQGIKVGKGHYGLGVFVSKISYTSLPQTFFHTGSFLGFKTRFKANRKSKDAVIIFTNTDSIKKMTEHSEEEDEKKPLGPSAFNKQMIVQLAKLYQLDLK